VTRSPDQRLDDIDAAITRIGSALRALETGPDDAQADLLQDAILYRLLVIGEAAKALPESVRHAAPILPWRNIMRLRDLLAHQYHRIDPAIIHATCDEPLTQLRAALPALRAAAMEVGR
jgi:uncharacterized protein with HEPN domain